MDLKWRHPTYLITDLDPTDIGDFCDGVICKPRRIELDRVVKDHDVLVLEIAIYLFFRLTVLSLSGLTSVDRECQLLTNLTVIVSIDL